MDDIMREIKFEKIDNSGKKLPGKPSNGDLSRIVHNNSTGTIEEKIFRDPPPKSLQAFMHVAVAGPTLGDVVAIPNDGITKATVTFTLRESKHPAGKVSGNINGPWLIALRNADDKICDYLKLMFAKGTTTIEYTSTSPAKIAVSPRDVNGVLDGAEMILATSQAFVVYRDFTQE